MENDDLKVCEAFEQNKLTLSITINERMLHDQIVSAIEGGSNYWARINVGKHEPGWRNYFTASFTVMEPGGKLKDGTELKGTYKLSIAKLIEGLGVMAEQYPRHFADVIGETGDATTGDVLVQCALFAEIIFG